MAQDSEESEDALLRLWHFRRPTAERLLSDVERGVVRIAAREGGAYIDEVMLASASLFGRPPHPTETIVLNGHHYPVYDARDLLAAIRERLDRNMTFLAASEAAFLVDLLIEIGSRRSFVWPRRWSEENGKEVVPATLSVGGKHFQDLAGRVGRKLRRAVWRTGGNCGPAFFL